MQIGGRDETVSGMLVSVEYRWWEFTRLKCVDGFKVRTGRYSMANETVVQITQTVSQSFPQQ